MKKQNGDTTIDMLMVLLFVVWLVASWLTHVIVCIKTASWGFLIVGAIVFPIACIHGTGIWIHGTAVGMF